MRVDRRTASMKCDTIKSLATEIKELWPFLDVRVERGYCNTDRKIPGTRMIHRGKGRWGSRIIVRDKKGKLLLDHNNAETYRRTREVRSWMDSFKSGWDFANRLADKYEGRR